MAVRESILERLKHAAVQGEERIRNPEKPEAAADMRW
jgi:hypothetical protein